MSLPACHSTPWLKLLSVALSVATLSSAEARRSSHEDSKAGPPPTSFEPDERFPAHPHPEFTPGALCVTPDSRRYSENIPYCKRDVESSTKREIIRTYDMQLGYRIQSMNRGDFKIDHLIPLCAGGSNEVINLWPQHKSVYAITDPIEEPLCRLMQMGKLMQEEAVSWVREAKFSLEQAPLVFQRIQDRLHEPRTKFFRNWAE